ncbi:MAG: peptidoglycan-associated lipoprotein Pal [Thermodesulfovibrionales bacterium]|nr:peptidoglycan-associated lipoprotein Pal [Nitrospinota bacterium]MCG2710231.1 peptidoglycan-associated lipoprotein Pal [Thermodesulfovibrionales bacterium]
MKRIPIIILMLGLIGFGCSQKKIALAPEDTGKQYETSQTQPKLDETKKASEGPQKTEQKSAMIKPEIESREIPLRGKRMSEILKDIYFDFDKYDVRDDAKPVLRFLADYLIKNTSESILMEGHCDERGTNEYNLALGEKRALLAKKYLLSFGVSSSRLETISYGEGKPLCAEKTEGCWAKNRRVHFVISERKN